ncbi:Uncharacterised protein [Bordetella pertussis]|nr:Uncharacterised protein [Bordetella pertussis]
MSARWIEPPPSRSPRLTSMNWGSSAGRQVMSSSVSTCEMIAPLSLTAGDTSALMKCRGTLVCRAWLASTRWKSTCMTCGL